MSDVLTPEQRRLNMSRIKSKDTKPEMLVRKELHARGFRYRLHEKSLPGRPDLVLVRFKTAIFVNGCFWHGHDCLRCKIPAIRREFWEDKISKNATRDRKIIDQLTGSGWNVLIVWECALYGPLRFSTEEVINRIERFLEEHVGGGNAPKVIEIRGI